MSWLPGWLFVRYIQPKLQEAFLNTGTPCYFPNILLEVRGKKLSVECAYQGSKVFTNGGPYTDLYSASSRDAKTDERLRTTGNFVGYSFFGEHFPDKPVTAFYDWLYLTALSQNLDLANKLFEFQGFSDIVFNPDKSLNCRN